MKKTSKIINLSLIAATLCGCGLDGIDLIYNIPKSKEYMSLDPNLVDKTALKTLKTLDPFFKENLNTENLVVSPASYLLAVSGLYAVSSDCNYEAYGLSEGFLDLKNLLESWNYEVKREESDTSFNAASLYQQVGDAYKFDTNKRNELKDKYISTLVSKNSSFKSDAKKFFKEVMNVEFNIPVRDDFNNGIITYGALSMRDTVVNGLSTRDNNFNFIDGTNKEVSTTVFGSTTYPKYLPYYAGENYEAFVYGISETSLLIIIPNNGIDLNSIDISLSYEEFMNNKKIEATVGYIPYFHVNSDLDLSSSYLSNETHKEKYYDKLLVDGTINDLKIEGVLQSCDFKFDRYGVAGRAITVMPGAGSVAPEEHEVIRLNVDRPFIAISLKDNFPLFVSKVFDPTK